MRVLRKFLSWSGHERVLAIRAFNSVIFACVLVRLFPYSALKRRLHSAPHAASRVPAAPNTDRIVQMVSAISQRVPMTTCLVNAIAAQNLLAAYGHASTLQIGVRLDERGDFSAHAWLEKAGRVLIGGAISPDSYKALEIPGAAASPSREKP